MSTTDVGALAGLAEDVARRAGDELLRRYGSATGVESKSSATDPVSDADRASERLIAAAITRARPGDAIVGEEGSDRAGSSGLRWVIDPLDGTVNYLYGHPGWAVSVGCYDDEGAVAGVVYDPVHDELFAATRGAGAECNGRSLAVNDPVPLEHALIATGFSYDPTHRRAQAAVAARLLGAVRDIRRVGAASLDLCWLAAGRVDGYYEDSTSWWDWAAGALIAREAGAVVSELRPTHGSGMVGVVAAGVALHDRLRRAVTEDAG